MKRLMRKAKDSGQDPYLCFLDYRNTPLEGLPSPAQLLMGRRTRSTQLLRPQTHEPTWVNVQLNQNQQKQKLYYDQGAKPRQPLHPGDVVRMKSDKQWKKGKINKNASTPRSYIVQVGDAQYRRNRKDLIKTRESYTEQPVLHIPEDIPTVAEIPVETKPSNTTTPPVLRDRRNIQLPIRYRDNYDMT